MEKQLWPVMVSVGVWHLGYSLYGPFVALWILRDLGHPSFLVLAIIVSLPTMVSIIGISFLSRIADQKGQLRELLSITAFVGSFQFICLRLFARSTISFLLVALPLSIFTMAFYTLAAALATSICDPETKGEVSSLLLLFASLGWSLGSFGSGRAFRVLGMHTVLLIAALFLIFAGFLVLISANNPMYDVHKDNPSVVSLEKNDNTSYQSILKNNQIRLILLIASLIYFGTGGLFVLSTVFYVEGIGVLEDDFGVANAIATLLALPVLLMIGRGMDTFGRRFFFRFAVLLHLGWFVAVSLTHDPFILLLLWVIPLYAFISPALTAMMADLTDLSQRSRGIGLIQAVILSMQCLGAILGGIAADTYGLDALPLIALLFLPLALFFAFITSETQEKVTIFDDLGTTAVSDAIAAWLYSLDRKK